MFEMIVTLVMVETQDGVSYPITKIFRIEFDNEAAMSGALEKLANSTEGVVVAEQLRGSGL